MSVAILALCLVSCVLSGLTLRFQVKGRPGRRVAPKGAESVVSLAARGSHVVPSGPRFWIEAVDEHGRTIVALDVKSDDEAHIKERWTRLGQSSDVGVFTLHDSRYPGHRGHFSRGVA